jgi:N6-L-threonylcarbamoyladenine synthase/protein kinase Bud32
MLVEVAERALAHTGKKQILLVGGVAVNKRLQEMMEKMCEERNAKFYVVPQEYGGDNGLMIALTGMMAYKNKREPGIKENILPRWRTDEVPWFKT